MYYFNLMINYHHRGCLIGWCNIPSLSWPDEHVDNRTILFDVSHLSNKA